MNISIKINPAITDFAKLEKVFKKLDSMGVLTSDFRVVCRDDQDAEVAKVLEELLPNQGLQTNDHSDND